jgi:hypothetical protein
MMDEGGRAHVNGRRGKLYAQHVCHDHHSVAHLVCSLSSRKAEVRDRGCCQPGVTPDVFMRPNQQTKTSRQGEPPPTHTGHYTTFLGIEVDS